MDEDLKIKIEPHLLIEVFRVASEAREHLNEFLQDNDSDDVPIAAPVVSFFEELIKNHPDPEISRWFLAELERLREDASHVGS